MSLTSPTLARQTAGYLSVTSEALFLALLVLLHFLEPEFGPPHLISEYELGRFGYLMRLAFICLGVGSLLLARALWCDVQTGSGRIGIWWLTLVGAAYIGAGIFAPDPASILESRLHGVSGVIVILSSPIVFTLLMRSLIRNPEWSYAGMLLKSVTVAACLGVVLFYGSVVIFYGLTDGSETVVVGYTNRFMIAMYCAWLITVGLQTIKTQPAST